MTKVCKFTSFVYSAQQKNDFLKAVESTEVFSVTVFEHIYVKCADSDHHATCETGPLSHVWAVKT